MFRGWFALQAWCKCGCNSRGLTIKGKESNCPDRNGIKIIERLGHLLLIPLADASGKAARRLWLE
jgi:hypothetical protein